MNRAQNDRRLRDDDNEHPVGTDEGGFGPDFRPTSGENREWAPSRGGPDWPRHQAEGGSEPRCDEPDETSDAAPRKGGDGPSAQGQRTQTGIGSTSGRS